MGGHSSKDATAAVAAAEQAKSAAAAQQAHQERLQAKFVEAYEQGRSDGTMSALAQLDRQRFEDYLTCGTAASLAFLFYSAWCSHKTSAVRDECKALEATRGAELVAEKERARELFNLAESQKATVAGQAEIISGLQADLGKQRARAQAATLRARAAAQRSRKVTASLAACKAQMVRLEYNRALMMQIGSASAIGFVFVAAATTFFSLLDFFSAHGKATIPGTDYPPPPYRCDTVPEKEIPSTELERALAKLRELSTPAESSRGPQVWPRAFLPSMNHEGLGDAQAPHPTAPATAPHDESS